MSRALAIAILLAQTVFAQYSFTVKPSRTIVPAGEPFEVELVFSGASTGISSPTLSELDNLDLAGGPSSSTNVSIVNGKMSSSASFSYIFRGKKPGAAKIGAAQVTYKGRVYRTEPANITIAPAGSKQSSSGGGDDVFIRVYADKTDAFVGEQIVLTYKLFFAARIAPPEIKELPQAKGFWSEDFDLPQQMTLRDEVIDGKSYRSGVFRKVALFATTAGELTVEPLKATVRVERREKRKSPLNDPFFGDPFFNFGTRMDEVAVSTRTLNLKIRPLPQELQPATFSGAVGDFDLSAKLDRAECQAHDAVTMLVHVRGVGNIKTLPAPQVSIPSDFESYDPKTGETIKRGPERVTGSKSFEYVLIPRAPGKQTIPEIRFSYFDPDKKKYVEQTAGPFTLDVSRGDGTRPAETPVPYAAKRGVETIGQDIAFAKTEVGEFSSSTRFPHQETWFWLWVSSPWAVIAAVSVARRRQDAQGRSLSGRRRRALLKAKLELDAARKLVESGNQVDASRHAIQGAGLLLAEWTGIPAGNATVDQWEAQWRLRSFSENHWTVIRQILISSDRVRYGGASAGGELRAEIEQFQAVLSELGGGA